MASWNKIVVGFLSVSTENSTDHLIEKIKREKYDFRCVFLKLTQQDLQSFQPEETYDAVVLLHSISQGRNSITDVPDAKYSKLLPQLKKSYGPDRVAVVVHSMTSFNSNTKKALMMIFKKSQPATFQCSNCVIQCNNLAEMPDFSQLTKFLREVPDHPLPIADKEAHSTLTTTTSADKMDKIETADNPQSKPVSGSVTKGSQEGVVEDPLRGGLTSKVPPTQSTKGQPSMACTAPDKMGAGNLPIVDSGPSQLVACPPITAQVSPKVDTSLNRYDDQHKVIDTTYPIALFSLSSSKHSKDLMDGLGCKLPGKTFILIYDIKDLASSWHMFEAILVDVGLPKEATLYHPAVNTTTYEFFQKCLKEMLVPENIAILMLAPANTPSGNKRALQNKTKSTKMHGVPEFHYRSESGRPSFFDDLTINSLVSWLLDSCERFNTAADKKGPGYMKRFKDFVCNFV